LKATLPILFLSLFSLSFNPVFGQDDEGYKEALVNGAVFRWRINSGNLECELKAPTPGWVAVGFKSTSGIVQSNQIMGSFSGGIATCEDHTVIDLRNHVPVEDVGGSNALISCDVIESNGYTELFFSLPATAYDGYHYNFEEGEEMFVTISYSRNDDFISHPVKQVQIRIIL